MTFHVFHGLYKPPIWLCSFGYCLNLVISLVPDLWSQDGMGGGGQADHFMEYFLSPLSDTWVMIPDQYVLEKDLTRLNSGDLTGINQQFGFQSI